MPDSVSVSVIVQVVLYGCQYFRTGVGVLQSHAPLHRAPSRAAPVGGMAVPAVAVWWCGVGMVTPAGYTCTAILILTLSHSHTAVTILPYHTTSIGIGVSTSRPHSLAPNCRNTATATATATAAVTIASTSSIQCNN